MTADTKALTVSQTAMTVDDAEAASFAAQLMKHAAAGAALFPKDLTNSQATILARLAIAYGLDPMAGELIPYQGKAYVTIDGRVRKAQEHAAYDGLECVPASDAERKAFRCDENEHLWVARVWRKDRRLPFVGYGRAGGKGDRNPVSGTYPQEMAQKRAKSRALRDAFAMPLPSYEEDAPQTRQATRRAPHEARGEVIEGEHRVINPDQATGELPVSDENAVTGSQITTIHTLIRLMKLADPDYRAFLADTFGVESSTQLTEGQAAAFCEALSAVLANAQDEGRTAHIAEVAQRIKRGVQAFNDARDDDDPNRRAARSSAAEAPTVIDAQPATPADGDADAAHWREAWLSAIKGSRFEDTAQAAAFMQEFTESQYPKNAAMWVADIDDFLDYATEEDRNRLIAAVESAKEPARRAAQATRVHAATESSAPIANERSRDWIRRRMAEAGPEVVAAVGEVDYDALSTADVERIKSLLDGKAP